MNYLLDNDDEDSELELPELNDDSDYANLVRYVRRHERQKNAQPGKLFNVVPDTNKELFKVQMISKPKTHPALPVSNPVTLDDENFARPLPMQQRLSARRISRRALLNEFAEATADNQRAAREALEQTINETNCNFVLPPQCHSTPINGPSTDDQERAATSKTSKTTNERPAVTPEISINISNPVKQSSVDNSTTSSSKATNTASRRTSSLRPATMLPIAEQPAETSESLSRSNHNATTKPAGRQSSSPSKPTRSSQRHQQQLNQRTPPPSHSTRLSTRGHSLRQKSIEPDQTNVSPSTSRTEPQKTHEISSGQSTAAVAEPTIHSERQSIQPTRSSQRHQQQLNQRTPPPAHSTRLSTRGHSLRQKSIEPDQTNVSPSLSRTERQKTHEINSGQSTAAVAEPTMQAAVEHAGATNDERQNVYDMSQYIRNVVECDIIQDYSPTTSQTLLHNMMNRERNTVLENLSLRPNCRFPRAKSQKNADAQAITQIEQTIRTAPTPVKQRRPLYTKGDSIHDESAGSSGSLDRGLSRKSHDGETPKSSTGSSGKRRSDEIMANVVVNDMNLIPVIKMRRITLERNAEPIKQQKRNTAAAQTRSDQTGNLRSNSRLQDDSQMTSDEDDVSENSSAATDNDILDSVKMKSKTYSRKRLQSTETQAALPRHKSHRLSQQIAHPQSTGRSRIPKPIDNTQRKLAANQAVTTIKDRRGTYNVSRPHDDVEPAATNQATRTDDPDVSNDAIQAKNRQQKRGTYTQKLRHNTDTSSDGLEVESGAQVARRQLQRRTYTKSIRNSQAKSETLLKPRSRTEPSSPKSDTPNEEPFSGSESVPETQEPNDQHDLENTDAHSSALQLLQRSNRFQSSSSSDDEAASDPKRMRSKRFDSHRSQSKQPADHSALDKDKSNQQAKTTQLKPATKHASNAKRVFIRPCSDSADETEHSESDGGTSRAPVDKDLLQIRQSTDEHQRLVNQKAPSKIQKTKSLRVKDVDRSASEQTKEKELSKSIPKTAAAKSSRIVNASSNKTSRTKKKNKENTVRETRLGHDSTDSDASQTYAGRSKRVRRHVPTLTNESVASDPQPTACRSTRTSRSFDRTGKTTYRTLNMSEDSANESLSRTDATPPHHTTACDAVDLHETIPETQPIDSCSVDLQADSDTNIQLRVSSEPSDVASTESYHLTTRVQRSHNSSSSSSSSSAGNDDHAAGLASECDQPTEETFQTCSTHNSAMSFTVGELTIDSPEPPREATEIAQHSPQPSSSAVIKPRKRKKHQVPTMNSWDYHPYDRTETFDKGLNVRRSSRAPCPRKKYWSNTIELWSPVILPESKYVKNKSTIRQNNSKPKRLIGQKNGSNASLATTATSTTASGTSLVFSAGMLSDMFEGTFVPTADRLPILQNVDGIELIGNKDSIHYTRAGKVDYWLYDNQGFTAVGYMRFNPTSKKKMSRAKESLDINVMIGVLSVVIGDTDEVDYEAGVIIRINKGIYYKMRNRYESIALAYFSSRKEEKSLCE